LRRRPNFKKNNLELIDIILKAGRSAVEIAFFLLLPIMVVMLFLMRLLEAWGVMDWIVVRAAPILKPAGLTGLSVFAALQVNFVSFAAPIATLSIMQNRGTSDRHLAATLAMILAAAQANVAFPFAAVGLHLGSTLLLSFAGGVIAAAVTYYLFGHALSTEEARIEEAIAHSTAEGAKGVLDVLNRAGAEAFKIAIGTIPMLVISMMAITYLRSIGLLSWLTLQVTPSLSLIGVDAVIVLPTLTKVLAGGTAMMGLVTDMQRSGTMDAHLINQSAGWLIQTFYIPGFAIILSAGKRVASVWKPAALGAAVGIVIRTLSKCSKVFDKTRFNQNCEDSTPEVCNAFLFDRPLKCAMKRFTCSSNLAYCLLALMASLPCPHSVSIGLSSGARLGSQSNRICN